MRPTPFAILVTLILALAATARLATLGNNAPTDEAATIAQVQAH